MGLIEYQNTALDRFAVERDQIFVEEVIVGHEDEICLILGMRSIVVGAEAMSAAFLFDRLAGHYLMLIVGPHDLQRCLFGTVVLTDYGRDPFAGSAIFTGSHILLINLWVFIQL